MAVQVRKHQPVERRRKQVARNVTLLQDAGEKSAPIFRQRFKRKRRANTPLAAHGYAK